jgi:hypothetical protein
VLFACHDFEGSVPEILRSSMIARYSEA